MIGYDNESYQVKFNKPGDMRIGINELVCNLIGLEQELPMFEPVIANISQEFIDSNKNYLNFVLVIILLKFFFNLLKL